MACEDYPCCGHETGDCPVIDEDGSRRWKCAGCDTILKVRARSSLCNHCVNVLHEHDYEPDWQD